MYSVIDVDEDQAASTEQLGSKEKFWFSDRNLGKCLFKLTRPTTGEDWSEKVAEECAVLLELPCAHYELAQSQRGRGVVTPSFVPKRGTLIHGNELLLELVPGYGQLGGSYRVSQHTIDLVFDTLSDGTLGLPVDWQPITDIALPVEVFVGYLMLDALIGNTDRHHENWGLIDVVDPQTNIQSRHLAPTYDHASSLGRNESEENVSRRLTSRDRGYTVQKYAEKCHSAFFLKADDHKPLTTYEAFKYAAAKQPHAAQVWLNQLDRIDEREIARMFSEIPVERISPVVSGFAEAIIRFNKGRLVQ
ncbi:MAG TPA: hypothetical protein VI306_00355 [Pyrinomonadaceae bacterium]